MALNPGIILAGETPDIIGTLARSTQAAAQRNELTRQNALADLYRTQGAGIAAGDPGAVNALAGYDPYAAMQVQDTVTQRGYAANQESRAQSAAARAAAEWAQSQDAATVAAEREKLEGTLSGAAYYHQRGDKAGYDAFVRQNGADPAQYPFEQFPAIAAQFGEVLQVWQGFAPPAPPNPTKGAPTGYMFNDPNNPGAGVTPLPGYEKSSGITINTGSEVGSIPQGYELFTDPNTGARRLRPIEGGPEDRSKADAAAAADQAQKSNLLTEDIGRAKAIINESPWLTTGLLGGILKSWGGTPAADTAALLDTIGANIAFDRLQAMRNSSPTGGALGQVTERELALLQATAGAIAQSQSAEQLLFNLTRLEQQINEVVNGPQGGVTNPAAGSGSQPPASAPAPVQLSPEAERLLQKYR